MMEALDELTPLYLLRRWKTLEKIRIRKRESSVSLTSQTMLMKTFFFGSNKSSLSHCGETRDKESPRPPALSASSRFMIILFHPAPSHVTTKFPRTQSSKRRSPSQFSEFSRDVIDDKWKRRNKDLSLNISG
jgi:hypothetical protein